MNITVALVSKGIFVFCGQIFLIYGRIVALNKHMYLKSAGLANPAPIIQTFYAEEEIFNNVKLDGVVTLVDAKFATIHLDEIKPKGVVNEAIEQIAYADRIIVNKVPCWAAHLNIRALLLFSSSHIDFLYVRK